MGVSHPDQYLNDSGDLLPDASVHSTSCGVSGASFLAYLNRTARAGLTGVINQKHRELGK